MMIVTTFSLSLYHHRFNTTVPRKLDFLPTMILRLGLALHLLYAYKACAESFEYQSDAARLLRVVGSALYHDSREFARELISNSADALEKYRLISLREGLDGAGSSLNVTVRAFPDDGRLVFADTGVGMTRDELRSNLGTIAKSGTSDFVASSSASTDLIGKFGLGL